MDIYDLTAPQLAHALRNLDRWLTRAESSGGDQLLSARLAPDQFAFVRQVQTATDNAKLMVARLAGKQAPSHPDTETTYAELRARIASVVEYLGTYTREDFAGASDRKITLPWMQPGQHMRAEDYVVQFALPNFYFHLVTAYSILRHHGVTLGKMDFIGPIAIQG